MSIASSRTATFMFSDVERSTHPLLTVGPEVYARTMDAHARLVRAAVDRGGGEVIGRAR